MKHRLSTAALVAALATAPLALTVTAAAAPAPSATTVAAAVGSGGTQERIESAFVRSADRIIRAKEHRAADTPSQDSAAVELAAAAMTNRIAGDDRFRTAIQISQDVHPNPTEDFGGIVFIANGLNFPDALAAGPAAASWMGPILLVPPTGGLPANVRAEIERLDPVEVVILGKTDNVSRQTENDLLGMFPPASSPEEAPVFRVAGDSRYETSAWLSLFVFGLIDLGNGEWDYVEPDTAYITTGLTFADALAGGAAGGYEGAPLFLTAPGVLSDAVATFLEPIPADPEMGYAGQEYTTVRILGSTASVSQAVVSRIQGILPNATITRYPGANRYETAAMLNADVFTGPVSGVTMTNGTRFPDALAGATRVNVTGGPTVLTQTACVPQPTLDTLETLTPLVVTALGKTDAVSDAALTGTSCAAASITAQAAQQLTNSFTPVPSVATSRSTLNSLVVAAAGSMAGYDRALFPHWRDADTWGWPSVPTGTCDVRQAALFREGKNVQYNSACSILGGSWLDPYTATTLFAISDVDIDHIVPLAEAWRSGASTWTVTRRTQFANDKLEVIAVDDGANASKGDKGPDLWKPPNTAAHCLYAKRWTAIKKAYTLRVTTSEKSALNTMLNTCAS